MRHIVYTQADVYPVALLIKTTAFKASEIETYYTAPLEARGVTRDQLLVCTLAYNDQGKVPVGFIKTYLQTLLPELNTLGVQTLYVADSAYFKVLTKVSKAEPQHGYVLPCKLDGYTHMNVVLGLNHQSLIYNPDLQSKLTLGLDTLAAHEQQTYIPLGSSIIHSAVYPVARTEIQGWLQKLQAYPVLTCDIETFSLRHYKAGVGTVSFAWDQHNGIAFPVDYLAHEDGKAEDGSFGTFRPDHRMRTVLREFFETYSGKLIWHNSTYDLKVLIYTLWMKDTSDTPGLLQGLEVMTRLFDDTKIIAYLATNSTAGNLLSLKTLAHEFAGNWAVEEINDISRIPLDTLLQYNLVDALSTWYVHNKFYPVMVQDQQESLYHSLMLPSLKVIIQMELTGMPMDPQRIQYAKNQLATLQDSYTHIIRNSPLIHQLNVTLRKKAWEKDFEGRKAKAKNPHKILPKALTAFDAIEFNPNSGLQLQELLYTQLDLPVIDLTDTKQPATGAETIEKLLNHTVDGQTKTLLKTLVDYGKVDKILTSFIPAFLEAYPKGDGLVYLYGSFVLGGTVSGRLSSKEPNLQNLPAGSAYGKLIKSCFVGPQGWIYAGADFNALEDRINTLLTKDPNKIRVFTEGYDSHCLRAFYFFPERLPGVTETVQSINSIKKVFAEVRQDAKSPAFALQYDGTWRTLVKNLGFPEELAKRIEDSFHTMYHVSREWTQGRIKTAAQHGYAEAAFGLRIRTPLLKQVIWNGVQIPREAQAESRTLGNAISGQSYGLLNNRAANAFMAKVWASPYRYDILPVGMIHDAFYLLIRDDLEVVHWVNNELPEEMSWQQLPEIQHNEVKLGAEIDLFYKGWHQPITLPNNSSTDEILQIVKEEIYSYDNPE